MAADVGGAAASFVKGSAPIMIAMIRLYDGLAGDGMVCVDRGTLSLLDELLDEWDGRAPRKHRELSDTLYHRGAGDLRHGFMDLRRLTDTQLASFLPFLKQVTGGSRPDWWPRVVEERFRPEDRLDPEASERIRSIIVSRLKKVADLIGLRLKRGGHG